MGKLKPHVEAHEGLTGAPALDSHWGIWQDQLAHSRLPEKWEALVGTDAATMSKATVSAYDTFINGADAHAAQVALDTRDNDDVIHTWSGGCAFTPYP